MKIVYRKPETKIFNPAFKDRILAHSDDWGDSNDYTFDTEEEDEALELKKTNIWE